MRIWGNLTKHLFSTAGQRKVRDCPSLPALGETVTFVCFSSQMSSILSLIIRPFCFKKIEIPHPGNKTKRKNKTKQDCPRPECGKDELLPTLFIYSCLTKFQRPNSNPAHMNSSCPLQNTSHLASTLTNLLATPLLINNSLAWPSL